MRQLVLALCLLASVSVGAEEDRTGEARRLFQRGAELVKQAQWAEALAAFERSSALRPHAVTSYNTAACERALGRYTRAATQFTHALAMTDADGGRLPDVLRAEAEALSKELSSVLVRLDVVVEPIEASISVDGRPLASGSSAEELVAGLAEPGAGHPAPAPRFALVLDPGAHLITLSRPGYTDAVVRETFAPGTRGVLPLKLARLPAHLRVAANLDKAVVTLDGLDVGVVPVELARPAGSYLLTVRRAGYVGYRSQVALDPGQAVDIRATLDPVRPALWKKWWFWTALGAGATAVALGGYFGARAAETPRIDGGGLQWAVQVR